MIREQNRQDYLQRLERLRPMDDLLMRRLFKDNIPLTQWMLQIILDKKDLAVTSVTTQSDFPQLTGIRSVTLDIDAVDSEGKRYDIEFQNASSGAKPERARYHSAVLDTASLKATEDFEQLPETYVIFITGKDYFKTDQPVYHIERINVETGEYFNDRAHIIYVNSAYENDNEIGRLLHDLRCNDPDEMYDDLIKRDTKYLKTNPREVQTMCQVIEELVDKGRAEGVEKTLSGLADEMKAAGVTEELIKMIVENYQKKVNKGTEV